MRTRTLAFGKTMRVKAIVLAAILCVAQGAQAEPSSGRVTIVNLRPYANGNLVYLHVSSGELCNTEVFTIDTGVPNGKEIYAAALTAVASGKQIIVEVSNDLGCTGGGSRVQSIYILP